MVEYIKHEMQDFDINPALYKMGLEIHFFDRCKWSGSLTTILTTIEKKMRAKPV